MEAESCTAAAPDLVERRNELLFAASTVKEGGGSRIGIPNALTTHSLYPLYATFFSGLGMEVVLSNVDLRGDLKSNSGFCFPAQIAHGAVFDLAQRGLDWVLLPHCWYACRAPITAGIRISAGSRRPNPISWRKPSPESESSLRSWTSLTVTSIVQRSLKRPCAIWECRAHSLSRRGAPLWRPNPKRTTRSAKWGKRPWAGPLRTESRQSSLPAEATTLSHRRLRSRLAKNSPAWASRPSQPIVLRQWEKGRRRGIILKPVDVSELLLYATYRDIAVAAQTWGLKPGGRAFAKACTRFFQPDGKQYLEQWLGFEAERKCDAHYRNLFRRTGLLVAGPNEVPALFEKAAEHVSPALYGEVIPTVGKGLEAASEGYDGLIVIGPFNCLPFRISEAILKPLSIQQGMPMLVYESDGYPVPPSFLRQVEVHIQQVLDRADRNHESRCRVRGRLTGLFKSAPGKPS